MEVPYYFTILRDVQNGVTLYERVTINWLLRKPGCPSAPILRSLLCALEQQYWIERIRNGKRDEFRLTGRGMEVLGLVHEIYGDEFEL